MSHTILFLCPHGAAKSVLAAAYFQQLAKQYGLDVQANSAGTEPDAAVSPVVIKLLRAEGIAVPTQQPRRVTASELQSASRVVSLGCELDELPMARSDLIRWDDVPPVSQNAPAAREVIRARVADLIAQWKSLS